MSVVLLSYISARTINYCITTWLTFNQKVSIYIYSAMTLHGQKREELLLSTSPFQKSSIVSLVCWLMLNNSAPLWKTFLVVRKFSSKVSLTVLMWYLAKFATLAAHNFVSCFRSKCPNSTCFNFWTHVCCFVVFTFCLARKFLNIDIVREK